MKWSTSLRTLRLLERDKLVVTGSTDHADWNYSGLLGFIARQRFRLVTSLLPERQVGRLLEIGYGSGVFIPELVRHAAHVFGVDVHDRAEAVAQRLAGAGVSADLRQAPAERLPFPDEFFDVVVAVSSLEFVSDLDATIREVGRVLRPGGRFVVVTPGNHPLLDAALKVATGESARDDFGDRRGPIVPALRRAMVAERTLLFPPLSPIPIYRALRLARRLHPAAVANVAEKSGANV